MGEAAEDANVMAEGDTPGDKAQESQDPDPMVFNVGPEDKEPEPEKPKEQEPKTAETPDLAKQFEELKQQNLELQKQLNRKFYNLRQERKQKEAEGAPDANKPPQFTDAQLLKILEEHRDDPAVQLQVIKHMTEQSAAKVKKEAVEDSTIKQQQQQAEGWLKNNVPDLFDEGSELRAKTDEMRNLMRLDTHPLGDFLAVAAAQMAAYPEMIKQAREEERKKVLAEAAEVSRKKAVKGGGPAGGTPPPKGSPSSDGEYIATGKSIGLTGEALKLYVQMRKQAKTQRQVMEA
jgi:hypothetical protein